MKKFGFVALVAGLAALATVGTADAQLFKKNQPAKIVVNNGGGQNVQVRQVQKGGLFNRQQITEVNVGGGQQFVRQPQRIFVQPQRIVVQPQRVVVQNNHHAVNLQLIQRQQFRGQLDQLNTYSYVHNTPANIRFVTQNQVYYQPQQLVQAPVQVQSYTVQAPAPVVVQEYTQPAPQATTAPPCAECANPGVTPAPTAGNPDVQYSTAPPVQRVVQRVVTVQRPVAVTNQVYVQTAPVRVRQFIQHGCN